MNEKTTDIVSLYEQINMMFVSSTNIGVVYLMKPQRKPRWKRLNL